MIKNKKGSALDFLFIIITLLALSFVLVITYYIYNSFNSNLQASTVLDTYDIGNNSKVASNQLNGLFTGVWDNSFLFLVIGMSVAAFVLAGMVRIHPMFLIFYIILLAIIILFCAIFSNMYQTLANDPSMTAIANNLVFTSYIMTYLPFIVGILGTILAIVMYKSYGENQ